MHTEKHFPWTFLPLMVLLFGTLAMIGCGSESGPLPSKSSIQVILASPHTTHTLRYDCSAFRPQVESGDDIHVLTMAASETMRSASAHERYVSAKAIQVALQARDWRTLERLIVEYRCEHHNEFSPTN